MFALLDSTVLENTTASGDAAVRGCT